MRGRIVLVPFPFDDLSSVKVRPAVCLTEAIGVHRHVVLAFITSVVPPALEQTDLLLDPATIDFGSTGLKVRSALRLHRIVTVSANLIRRELGSLTPSLQQEVKMRLGVLFGLQ